MCRIEFSPLSLLIASVYWGHPLLPPKPYRGTVYPLIAHPALLLPATLSESQAFCQEWGCDLRAASGLIYREPSVGGAVLDTLGALPLPVPLAPEPSPAPLAASFFPASPALLGFSFLSAGSVSSSLFPPHRPRGLFWVLWEPHRPPVGPSLGLEPLLPLLRPLQPQGFPLPQDVSGKELHSQGWSHGQYFSF